VLRRRASSLQPGTMGQLRRLPAACRRSRVSADNPSTVCTAGKALTRHRASGSQRHMHVDQTGTSFTIKCSKNCKCCQRTLGLLQARAAKVPAGCQARPESQARTRCQASDDLTHLEKRHALLLEAVHAEHEVTEAGACALHSSKEQRQCQDPRSGQCAASNDQWPCSSHQNLPRWRRPRRSGLQHSSSVAECCWPVS